MLEQDRLNKTDLSNVLRDSYTAGTSPILQNRLVDRVESMTTFNHDPTAKHLSFRDVNNST